MTTTLPQPLRNTRVLSLALNLPDPAALMRCVRMGAECTKLEQPPAPSADPMGIYNPAAYAAVCGSYMRNSRHRGPSEAA